MERMSYRDAELAADRMGETNDCAVRAIAVSCGVSYKEAHEALRTQGRKKRGGASNFQWIAAIRELGFHVNEVTGHFQAEEFDATGRKPLVFKTALKAPEHLDPDRRFILQSSGHVAAWNGEEIVDWSKGTRTRIRQIFEVAADATDMLPKKTADWSCRKQEKNDITFFVKTYRKDGDVEYRIYRRQCDYICWTNTARTRGHAEHACYNSSLRYSAIFVGELDNKDEADLY